MEAPDDATSAKPSRAPSPSSAKLARVYPSLLLLLPLPSPPPPPLWSFSSSSPLRYRCRLAAAFPLPRPPLLDQLLKMTTTTRPADDDHHHSTNCLRRPPPLHQLLTTTIMVKTVKVCNVSLSASDKDIKEFFSFSGDIEYNEGSQTAYVTFKDTQGAETAVLLSGATIVDQSVIIALAPGYKLPTAASLPQIVSVAWLPQYLKGRAAAAAMGMVGEARGGDGDGTGEEEEKEEEEEEEEGEEKRALCGIEVLRRRERD
ncbi:hypothetical protein Droror1_Dr00025585 [Drosera rotundifolia]